ncbi:hypothetical protein SBOR_6997 [Sclerotinia borealis F-4128]|uniref:Uncharacterized protein n=1 Tax=Sclerotinia borealis (strain F-4128) TaxID=1432307 RepID=W9CDH8_SCLBF|nr:hypothetical protein SBOR_6997 [Sclerotinia borealis F-4128]
MTPPSPSPSPHPTKSSNTQTPTQIPTGAYAVPQAYNCIWNPPLHKIASAPPQNPPHPTSILPQSYACIWTDDPDPPLHKLASAPPQNPPQNPPQKASKNPARQATLDLTPQKYHLAVPAVPPPVYRAALPNQPTQPTQANAYRSPHQQPQQQPLPAGTFEEMSLSGDQGFDDEA